MSMPSFVELADLLEGWMPLVPWAVVGLAMVVVAVVL